MRSLNEYITLNESGEYNLRPTSKDELKKLIDQRIKEQGPNCDLSKWNVSSSTNMEGTFETSLFRGKEPSWYKD